MIKKKYLKQLKKEINEFIGTREIKAFIFGSSLEKGHFADIDIGLMGNFKITETMNLKEKIEDTNLPYFVDIINFNQAEKEFKQNVLSNKILWIKP